jgi:hypothetical protein
VFKLIVFTKERVAERAEVDSSTVAVRVSLALDANSILQRTAAGVSGQAFPSVTNESFAEIADRSHHPHSSGEQSVFDDTVTSLRHALLLSALRADWQTLHRRTEIAESSRFLLSQTLVALHSSIA